MPKRITSDMMMPKMSAFCCSRFGVLSATKTMVKTKTLSMESEYSIKYPVKNSVAVCAPLSKNTMMPNTIAEVTQIAVKVRASRGGTTCDPLRRSQNRSMKRANPTKATNPVSRIGSTVPPSLKRRAPQCSNGSGGGLARQRWARLGRDHQSPRRACRSVRRRSS